MNNEHVTAQEISARAAALIAKGNTSEAKSLYAEAARYEAGALASVPSDKIRTRSVLSISVASLLYKGDLLDEAERAIFRYLAAGDLAPWAEAELRELLPVVTDERLLKANLGRRYSEESITVVFRGGEIGAGTGPLDIILDKAVGFRSLLYRMGEWVGQFPLRHHGPPPKELLELVQARATEPATGSYTLRIRLTEPAQPDLFEPMKVAPAEVSELLFNFLNCLSEGTPKDLADLVPQEDYRKALLQLTRNLLPGGKRLREIGIYREKQGLIQSVSLTDALPSKIREALPKEVSSTEEQGSFHGILRALNLDKNWLIIATSEGKHIRCDTEPEMLDDVVGPMVNRDVVIFGRVKGKGSILVSEIELADEE